MLDPETDIPNDGLHRWLVVDDLMEEVMAKGLLNSLYTKYSHHKNMTVFFHSSKPIRDEYENRCRCGTLSISFCSKTPEISHKL